MGGGANIALLPCAAADTHPVSTAAFGTFAEMETADDSPSWRKFDKRMSAARARDDHRQIGSLFPTVLAARAWWLGVASPRELWAYAALVALSTAIHAWRFFPGGQALPPWPPPRPPPPPPPPPALSAPPPRLHAGHTRGGAIP